MIISQTKKKDILLIFLYFAAGFGGEFHTFPQNNKCRSVYMHIDSHGMAMSRSVYIHIDSHGMTMSHKALFQTLWSCFWLA